MFLDLSIGPWPDASVVLFIAGAGFVGGLFRGYSGFGFSMGAVPLLSVALLPISVVPSVLYIEVIIALLTIRAERVHIEQSVLMPLLMGAFVGTPIGLIVLREAPADVVRFFLGLALGFAVVVVWHRGRAGITIKRLGLAAAGLISGVMNGGSAMSGPAAILALMATDLPANRIRATLIFYIGVSATMALVFSFLGGMQSSATVGTAMILAPAAAVGAFIGARIFRRFQNRGYRTAGLLFLLCVALIAIGSSLRSLIL